MRLTVIGTGYLGAVHAAGMADFGHDVLGFDIDAEKIAQLSAGHAPFYEPGLPELLQRTTASGKLRFTDSIDEVARFGDVHFVCVGTPQRAGSHAADMSYVDAVVDDLGARIAKDCLIVGKSTVPVGTAARLARRARQLVGERARVELAWNPEFLREGFAVHDTLHPDRLVFGVSSDRAERTLREVYRPVLDLGINSVTTDLATAELVKVAANSFLATKISFINAMSEVCESTGADVVTLAEAIGYDERIGRRFLNAGVGFGGGCLGKDIRAFRARGDELGVGEALRFLEVVDEVNDRRRVRVIELAETVTGGLSGSRVAVLGAAFKPNSDDVRDSPALHVARALDARGALVRVHDPEALHNARLAAPELECVDDVAKALEGADLVIHLTEWSEYQDLDPVAAAQLVDNARLIDARNTLDAAGWQAAGWLVNALGRTLTANGPAPETTHYSELQEGLVS